MCIHAHGVTSDFKVFQELVDLHLMQGQTRGSNFLEALLCSFKKHSMELFKLLGIFTDVAPCTIGSKSGMVTLLSKHMQELGLHSKLIHHHCISINKI
jgi:hypothetical protein